MRGCILISPTHESLVSVCYSIILALKFCSPGQLPAGQGSSFFTCLRDRILSLSLSSGGVLFHIVELRDLRGGLSKEDGHLPGGKGAERPIRLFDAVNQIGGEAEYGAPRCFSSATFRMR